MTQTTERLTVQQIAKRLTAIHTALVEKTGEQPWIAPTIRIEQNGKAFIHLYSGFRSEGNDLLGKVSSATIEEVLGLALEFIAKLPDHDEAKKRTFQKNLAKVIDEGEGINIPHDVMTPLRDGMKAMSENLLSYEGATE